MIPIRAATRPAAHRVRRTNDAYLREVDDRLAQAVGDLGRSWRDDLDHPEAPADILQERDLPDILRALTVSGGKRIRPSMCYWGWAAAGGDEQRGYEHVVQAGAALELLHIFALIHDDVMDESVSRRGQPSVHTLASQLHLHSAARGSAQRFGESIAVLVGDLAHAEADHLAYQLPPPLQRIWQLLVVELVRGQSLDLTGSAAGRRDLLHARRVARMKSGSYTIVRPLQLGAAAADADPAVMDALLTYGREVGEAFALRDDILGVFGDPQLTGKPAGDDLASGKPTVIMSLADERLEGRARRLLTRAGTPELSLADIAELQHAMHAGGIVETVESRISRHVQLGIDALRDPRLHADGVLGLTEMARRVAWRDK